MTMKIFCYANTPGVGVYGYPTWSSDGQWLAVPAAEQGFENWSWILVLSADGNLEKAQRLDLPDLSPINVDRYSRIAWY